MDRQRQRKLLSLAQADKLSSESSWVQGFTVLYQTISSSTIHHKVGFLVWCTESHLGTRVVQIPQESSTASPQPTNTHQYPRTHLSKGANTLTTATQETQSQRHGCWQKVTSISVCGFLFVWGVFLAWFTIPNFRFPTQMSKAGGS